jgi:hypothetical protein
LADIGLIVALGSSVRETSPPSSSVPLDIGFGEFRENELAQQFRIFVQFGTTGALRTINPLQ